MPLSPAETELEAQALQALLQKNILADPAALLAQDTVLTKQAAVAHDYLFGRGDEALQVDPAEVGLADWETFLKSYEATTGLAFGDVAEILSKDNTLGVHNHEVNPNGPHTHSPLDATTGEHQHTADNPFGLHSHSADGPLGGAHTHTLFNPLGAHAHDRPQDDTVTELQAAPAITGDPSASEVMTKLTKSLQLMTIAKNLDAIEEALVIALKTQLMRFDGEANYFVRRVKRHLKDSRLVKIGNVALAMTQILRDDLDFVTFMDGVIAAGPEGVDFFAATPAPEDVAKGCYDGCDSINSWQVEEIQTITDSADAVAKLIQALVLKLDGRGPALVPLMAQMATTLAAIRTFQLVLPDMATGLNDAGIIRIAPVGTPATGIPVLQKEAPAQVDISKGMDEQVLQSVRIIKADAGTEAEKEGIIKIVVLEPDVRDLQNQEVSEPVIYDLMKSWMMNGQVFGVNHTTFHKKQGTSNPDFRLIQCFQSPSTYTEGGQVIRKGSWVIESAVLNETYKQQVFSGVLQSISIGGTGEIQPDPVPAVA